MSNKQKKSTNGYILLENETFIEICASIYRNAGYEAETVYKWIFGVSTFILQHRLSVSLFINIEAWCFIFLIVPAVCCCSTENDLQLWPNFLK